MEQTKKTTRRRFLATSGLVTAGLAAGLPGFSALSYSNIMGSNERINMGFIGVGNRGSQLMKLFMQEKDSCSIAALCDVYEPYVTRDYSAVSARYKVPNFVSKIPELGERFEIKPGQYGDYRRLLDNKDIDAVCIATPDHWHALQTIDAVEAGKDVYCEKPLTQTIKEGRAMVNAQKRTGRVVAVGLNRRGNGVYQKLAGEIPAGKIGKVTVGSAYRINDMAPAGVGHMKPEEPPAGLDWDMWLGPRAYRPYRYNLAPYSFRWYSDFSSQMGNWGVHFMDVIRWMMGETAPSAICAMGGQYAIDHDGDIPDTMQVTYEFASGAIVTFCIYEASSGGLFNTGEVCLRGTKGTLYADEKGYTVVPTRPGQFQTWKPEGDKETFTWKDITDLGDGSNSNSTQALVQNFLKCVKTRETPLCPLEEGHRSTSFAHLANIALKTGERLLWDAEKEVFTNSEAANALLEYEYRKPWKL